MTDAPDVPRCLPPTPSVPGHRRGCECLGCKLAALAERERAEIKRIVDRCIRNGLAALPDTNPQPGATPCAASPS